MLELAERIARIAPGELEWCFFNSSGSEANESAMHLAVLYWELVGKASKIELTLSRVTSYHGSTLGALSLSGSRWRAPFEPLLHRSPRCRTAPPPRRVRPSWRRRSCRVGRSTSPPSCLEPVTGSSGAAMELPDGYLQAVREVCDRHEVLLVADEIVSGFGRTGRWFGVEHFGAVPDVITFGKGIGGGVIPLSGLVTTRPHP